MCCTSFLPYFFVRSANIAVFTHPGTSAYRQAVVQVDAAALLRLIAVENTVFYVV
jgi:hypothetical protein